METPRGVVGVADDAIQRIALEPQVFHPLLEAEQIVDLRVKATRTAGQLDR
jgi:hypothetical protein